MDTFQHRQKKQVDPMATRVGDAVVVTEEKMAHLHTLSRDESGAGWVAPGYIQALEPLVGVPGEVKQVHPSVGRILVDIQGKLFVMREDFVDNLNPDTGH